MWDGYMCFAGQAIINSSRLCAMVAAGFGPEGIQCKDCCPCPDLDLGLGFTAPYNPSDNPWYDPAEPDSWDFAGLLVTSITGLSPGEFVRPVTESAGIGAVIGQGRQTAPVITVTGILLGATCCSVEFGLRWFRSVLRGSCGPRTLCAGDDLTVLACEPTFPDQDCVGNQAALDDCIAACGGNAECEANCQAAFDATDYVGLLAPYYRTFRNAALISGPTISQIIPRGCPSCYECGLTEIQFSFSAGDPCLYREPVSVIDSAMFTCQAETGDCIEWVDNTDLSNDCLDDCPADDNCATDPNCTDTDPPSMPTILNPCVYECIALAFCRTCFDIPASVITGTAETALQLSIYSGTTAMRRINIRVWDNPTGIAVDDLDDCDICSELNISYIGPDSTLVIDSAARTATITCPGDNPVRANPFIASATGTSAFTYPVLACGGPFTVCITAADPVSPSAFASASVVAREC